MKILYKFLIVTIILVTVSCEDSLDIIQPGEIGEDVAFQSVDDLQLGLNGIYFGLNTDQAVQISSFFTDETSLGFENSGQNLELLQFQLNSVSVIPGILWVSNYRTINTVNRVLEAADKLIIADEEQDQFNDILGQLYAIRAAEYFELLTYFSTDLKDDDALGVMKLDFVPSIDDQLPRVSNAEIFEFIENDLTKAKNLLDNTRVNPIFITANFITALEARKALYRGNNTLARTKAQELINNIPLATRSQYFNLFRDATRAGTIFIGELNQSDVPANPNPNNPAQSQLARNYYFRIVGITGGAFMELGRALFNQLDPTDIRYNIIVQRDSDPDENYQTNNGRDDILLIGKYPGNTVSALQNDYKYFRIAEMYLIKAEAETQLNNLSVAAETLKELRDARFANPTVLDNYANQQEALTAVLNERRIELAFEGHRYVDLKRLNPGGIDRDPVDCERFNSCELNANEFFKYTFPIPQRELAGNAAIRGQQNPGY